MTTLTLDYIAQQAQQEIPQVPDARQRKLTQTLLQPNLKAIYTDLLRLRIQLDQQVAQQPDSNPRMANYPISCCLEISKGLMALLNRELTNPRTPGIRAIRRFVEQGGLAKRVWGNLRNQYFQNALQLGSLYVDVANDSVVITKPKVEILPLEKADFYPVTDYDNYARLAEVYWHAQVYPNRQLPALAPMFPLLLVYPSGQVQAHSAYQMLLYQNLLSDFSLAEQALLHGEFHEKRLPEAALSQLSTQLKRLPVTLTNNCPLVEDCDYANIGQHLLHARQSELRLDGARCQPLLELAHALSKA